MAKLLSTIQAAERLGIARATLAKLRVHGGGPPWVKLSTKVLYDEQDLDQWIASRPRHLSARESRSPIGPRASNE
jgi:predicted DNA-binding transcriptional regulator AlpA